MEYSASQIEEPKKLYLVKLVNMIDSVGWLLATNQGNAAMQLLASLLAQIEVTGEADENKELKQLQKNMVYDFENYIPQIQPHETHKFYHMVVQYMNKTYFKEMNFARPRVKEKGHLK